MSSSSPSPRECGCLHIRLTHDSTYHTNISPRRLVSVQSPFACHSIMWYDINYLVASTLELDDRNLRMIIFSQHLLKQSNTSSSVTPQIEWEVKNNPPHPPWFDMQVTPTSGRQLAWSASVVYVLTYYVSSLDTDCLKSPTVRIIMNQANDSVRYVSNTSYYNVRAHHFTW